MRQDANRISLRAIRAILAAFSSFEIKIADTTVRCVSTPLPPAPWPRSEGLDGLDEQADGPWPPGISVDCKWLDGGCTLIAECDYSMAVGKNRHGASLQVATSNGRGLMWITVPAAIGDASDDSKVVLQGRMSNRRRDSSNAELGQRLAQALRETLAASGLPLLTTTAASLGEISIPSGEVMDPRTTFERLIHLALLKIDFLDAGPAALSRGRPLIALSRWEITSEMLDAEEPASSDEPEGAVARAPSKREIIEQLKRDELQNGVETYGITVQDRRVTEQLVDGLVKAKRVKPYELLGALSRERLKEICVAVGLDDTGREKAILIERLCGDDVAADIDDEAPEPVVSVATTLSELLGSAFQVETPGSGWPSRGSLVLNDKTFAVDIYARTVGSSSRGNPKERRFQNPSQKSPIIDEPDRYELLFGVWTEQGTERAVIVAFEAHRRVDRATRFSLFVPVTILEQAADTGFATHETAKGEAVYAFRPDNIGRYFAAFLESETWRLQQPNTKLTSKREADLKASLKEPKQPKGDRISIRPQVAMYAAFARLNYKPWFAIAEFVDNSIQSFLGNREKLVAAGHDGPLVIDILIDDNNITVTDRAGGIAWKDFGRAFSPATPPDDASGLSEFGLGMKAAASWFAKKWSVRTSALGEAFERTITFDIPTITSKGQEELPIDVVPARESDHFTELSMTDLRVRPAGRTLTKIRQHLASIYRVLLADGTVKIRLTTSGRAYDIEFASSPLLEAPLYSNPNGPPVLWKQNFKVEIEGHKAEGWAGILKHRSLSDSGFSVFRRKRLIEGSVGETYKPHKIFGKAHSPAAHRLTGEIFLEGFDVTHTKDGIQWHGQEDEVLEQIAAQLNTSSLPLLSQADNYRQRTQADALPMDFGAEALDAISDAFSRSSLSEIPPPSAPDPVNGPRPSVPAQNVLQRRDFRVRILRDGQPWDVILKLTRDPLDPFYSTTIGATNEAETVAVNINLDHRFSVAFINDNEAAVSPLVHFIAALALGERLALLQGVKQPGQVRANANKLLLSVTNAGGAGE